MSASRSFASVAVLLLAALSGPALAGGGSIDATLVVGQTRPVSFSPGFKLDCKHDITITIGDEDVLCAVNPPAASKGTTFKFEAKKPGLVNVVVEYSASNPGCSGFAAVRRNILVTADLKQIGKDFKLSAKQTQQLVKAKLKTANKLFNQELNQIVKDYQSGEYDSVAEATSAVSALKFGLWMWVASNISDCLGDLSTDAKLALTEQAVDELLSEMQLGSCDSLFDDTVDSSRQGFEAFTAQVDKKAEKAVKKMQKMETGRETHVTLWTNHWNVGLTNLSGPDTGTGPADGEVGARFVLGFGWRETDEEGLTLSLGYHGTVVGDPSQSAVQVDIAGPNGYTRSAEHPLEVLANILAGNSLDSKLSAAGATGTDSDALVGATFAMSLIPEEGGGLEPGSYRLEVRYPDDVNPAQTWFVTVP